MIDIKKQLYTFWVTNLSDLSIAVYASGEVPRDAVYPYLTYQSGIGSRFSQTTLTAFLWLLEDGTFSVNEARNTFYSRVCEMIPEGGITLFENQEAIYLTRNSSDFISDYETGEVYEGKKVHGCRVSLIAEFFVK